MTRTHGPARECSWRREGGVRAIPNDAGNRLLRIVGRSSGSVVTWLARKPFTVERKNRVVDRLREIRAAHLLTDRRPQQAVG